MPPCFGYSSFVPSGVTIWLHRPLPRSAGSVYVVHAVPLHILCEGAPHPVLRQLLAQRMETNTGCTYSLTSRNACAIRMSSSTRALTLAPGWFRATFFCDAVLMAR